jgi:surfactin synthase thioesterase subunit
VTAVGVPAVTAAGSVTAVGAPSRWLPMAARDSGGLPLFCLPHAGAGASAFRSWLGRLAGIELVPVQPPGREARLREAPFESMQPLVEELAAVLVAAAQGRPYALYGHSLGALVAFETLREIRRRGDTEPVRLIVSGCVAPHLRYDDGPPVTGMSQQRLVQMLTELGGTPAMLLADPELLQLVLPAIRADFSVKESYQYASEAPLTVPITVLSSTDDPRAPEPAQQAWREQTLAGCAIHTLAGGHFAVFEQSQATLGRFAEALSRR